MPALWAIAFAIAIFAIAIVLLLPAQGSAAGLERVADSNRGARAYWTPARMRAAEPVDPATAAALAEAAPSPSPRDGAPSYVAPSPAGERVAAAIRAGEASGEGDRILGSNRDEILDPAAPAYSAHGKVFFTIPNGPNADDYYCSGTVVNSRNRSLVWTAGHCVFDAQSPKPGVFSSNFLFVPGYSKDDEGREVFPYGKWPARKLGTTVPYRIDGNLRYDVGAAVVAKNPSGERLQDVAGARGIGFNQPRDQELEAVGYPAVPTVLQPEFTGDREFRCTGPPLAEDRPGETTGPGTMGIECDMTAGSSGGGWVTRGPVPLLVSVTSYGYSTELDRLYGPYLSAGAKELYKQARGGKRKRR